MVTKGHKWRSRLLIHLLIFSFCADTGQRAPTVAYSINELVALSVFVFC